MPECVCVFVCVCVCLCVCVNVCAHLHINQLMSTKMVLMPIFSRITHGAALGQANQVRLWVQKGADVEEQALW